VLADGFAPQYFQTPTAHIMAKACEIK